MNHFLNDSVVCYFLTIWRALSTKWFLFLFEAPFLHGDSRSPFRLRETTSLSALAVVHEIVLSSRWPTSFLLIHSIGNSSSLWSLFKIFLSIYVTPKPTHFLDLPLVSFDWQKGFGSHWHLILERIEILPLWGLQSLETKGTMSKDL